MDEYLVVQSLANISGILAFSIGIWYRLGCIIVLIVIQDT